MPLAQDFSIVLDVLINATGNIPEPYFRLPIFGGNHQQRERAYCYELYYHMRLLWPKKFMYTLSGEVDKSGHPIINEHCGPIIPDFLVHNPGHMGPEDNLAIVEVKPIQQANIGKRGKLLSDVEKIECMTLLENGYYKGIILVFGEGHARKKDRIQQYFHDHCDPGSIRLLYHHQAGQQAVIVDY